MALSDYESGKISSLRAAAAAYGVPKTTLRDGTTTKQISREQYQRLTPAQEEFLADLDNRTGFETPFR